MRILQLIDHLGSGGAQTLVVELTAELVRMGIDVDVAHLFAPNAFHAELIASGARVHDLSTGQRYAPSSALDPRPVWALHRLLREIRYDVVHAHLYISPLHLLMAAPLRGRRLPIVNTVHAHQAELPGYVFPSYRLTKDRTNAFVADFPATIGELGSIGVPAGRVKFVPFGIEPIEPDRSIAPATLRAELGLAEDANVLLSVARLHPQRYLDRYIRALPRVNELAGNTHLLLVGDGPDEASLSQLAQDLGVRDRISFLGRRSDLATLYALADVVLTVSRDGDVGIAALQAVSAGVPCLSWDNAGLDADAEAEGGNRVCDVAADEEGFAVRAARLLDDRTTSLAAAATRAQFVRSDYTLPRMAGRHAEIYEELTGSGLSAP